MNNVISFLEEMGKNADLRLNQVDLESILNNDSFATEARRALLDKDHRSLERLLNAPSKMVCVISPPEDDDQDEDDSPDNNASFAIQFKQAS